MIRNKFADNLQYKHLTVFAVFFVKNFLRTSFAAAGADLRDAEAIRLFAPGTDGMVLTGDYAELTVPNGRRADRTAQYPAARTGNGFGGRDSFALRVPLYTVLQQKGSPRDRKAALRRALVFLKFGAHAVTEGRSPSSDEHKTAVRKAPIRPIDAISNCIGRLRIPATKSGYLCNHLPVFLLAFCSSKEAFIAFTCKASAVSERKGWKKRYLVFRSSCEARIRAFSSS